MFIDFDDDGSVSGVDNDLLDLLGEETSKVRVSHVEPVSFPLRVVFHLIRRCVRDDSSVAAWTRRWRCRWRSRMLVGSKEILGPFGNRADAINAELDWLDNEVNFKVVK